MWCSLSRVPTGVPSAFAAIKQRGWHCAAVHQTTACDASTHNKVPIVVLVLISSPVLSRQWKMALVLWVPNSHVL